MSLQNGPFWLVKRPFLSAEKDHFAMPFGMFCKLIELQLLTKPLLIMSTFELSLQSCYTIIYRYADILPFRAGLERQLPLV